MTNKINDILNDYIITNSITLDSLDYNSGQTFNHLEFFNYITTSCLGNTSIQYDNYHETTSSLNYLADNAKEKFISGTDCISISALYIGIITNGNLKFNYDNYELFVNELYSLRKQFKKELYNLIHSNIENKDILTEILSIKITLIKIYLNAIYGMINKDGSVLTSKLDAPRIYIIETSKHIMLQIASFLLNKSKPIYYIDVDELYTEHISNDEINELNSYIMNKCNHLINFKISSISIDENEQNRQAYFVGKKKFIMGSVESHIKIQGLPMVDNNKVLVENKKFFGKLNKDIFPNMLFGNK